MTLGTKIISANIFLNLYINRYKTLAPKALPPERFKSDMELRYQMIVQLYRR